MAAAVVGAAISATVPLIIRHVIDTCCRKDPHRGVGRLGRRCSSCWPCCSSRPRSPAGSAPAGSRSTCSTTCARTCSGPCRAWTGPSQDALETGQIVSRSITDIGLVQGLLSFLPILSSNALLFVVSLVIMAVLSPLLTLVTLLIAPALLFIAYRSRNDLFPANWDAQQQAGVLLGEVEAAVTGVRVVKGFGQEARELADLEVGATKLFASPHAGRAAAGQVQPGAGGRARARASSACCCSAAGWPCTATSRSAPSSPSRPTSASWSARSASSPRC